MSAIAFWVPGVPIGVPRPRARHVEAPGRPGFTRVYTPRAGNYGAWVRRVEFVASCAGCRPRSPLQGPLRLLMVALVPRPRRLCRRRDPPGLLWAPANRNDFDNLVKAQDALTRLGYWEDDRQICDGRVLKGYHAIGAEPGALFVVSPLGPTFLAEALALLGAAGVPCGGEEDGHE